MLTQEQYDSYYKIIMNNIAKLRQSYKHINEFLSFETVHYLIELVSTWEFDNKWIKYNVSKKLRSTDNKDEIRNEFYDKLIAAVDVTKAKLDELCGFYSLDTSINYRISSEKTIQKLEGRKIVISDDKENEKIIITFFFIYHMLLVDELISDTGITITLEELKKDFNNEYDIINLCKICTKDTLIRNINEINDLKEYSSTRNIPMWFMENAMRYEKHYQNQ